MNFDPFTQEPIHQHGIWNSGCLSQEHATLNYFETTLTNLGYQRDDQQRRNWHRGDKKVVLCLVDDIRDCASDYHIDVPYMFDRNTTVITDNYVGCPTQYRVWQLPPSFYGIYSHNEPMPEWQPDRQFCFSVNRIDTRRLKLVLELAKRIHLHKGYVNFNCQDQFDGNTFGGTDRLPAVFEKYWNNELSDDDKAAWQASYKLLAPQMPLKNYDIAHHEIYTRSWLNVECETYSSDNTMAVSEKIFRLLTLPVPWTAYMGRYGVAYLESIGFDCMSDMIEHNHYDRLKVVENRIGVFIWKSVSDTSKVLREGNQDQIRARCLKAATYNRELLNLFKKNWDTEFEQWKQAYLPHLA